MSQQIPGHVETFVTGADLSTHKSKFLKVTADNTVGLATAPADPVIGVQYDIPFNAAGAQVAVMLDGTPIIMAGAAFSAGAKLMPDGSGRAIVATASGNYHAIAIQAATALGDLVQCKLQNGVA